MAWHSTAQQMLNHTSTLSCCQHSFSEHCHVAWGKYHHNTTAQHMHCAKIITLCSRCGRAPASCGMCAKKVITGETITADILKLAELEPDELLYWSHDNTALSHLPYMICLDKYGTAHLLHHKQLIQHPPAKTMHCTLHLPALHCTFDR